MNGDSLGDRMKEYENAYRVYLPRRLPVIVRVDMRAGHTYTRGFIRPFDHIFHEAMVKTAQALCKEISGCKLAYTQSDEISLLVTNDDTIETQPWFNNNLQKIVSLAAATASISFQHEMAMIVAAYDNSEDEQDSDFYYRTYIAHLSNVMFDARAFILPEEEIINYFIWRQQDATRNSIQMAARAYFSHKECENKNSNELQNMLINKNINWNDYKVWEKRGICIHKIKVMERTVYDNCSNPHLVECERTRWLPDNNTPIFTQNREYIQNCFLIGED